MNEQQMHAINRLLDLTAGLEEDSVGQAWPELVDAVRALRAAVAPRAVVYTTSDGAPYRVLEMMVTRDLFLYGHPVAVIKLLMAHLNVHGAIVMRYVDPHPAPQTVN